MAEAPATVGTDDAVGESAPVNGESDGTSGVQQSQKSDCDRDFDLYESERPEIRKAELDSEKSLDTTLVALSTLALGTSLTVLKDFIGREKAVWLPILIVAWAAFLACLLLSLWDKKLTYDTHKAWRELLDEKFANWHPGVWDEAFKEYPNIRGMKPLPTLKKYATGSLVAGIVLLSAFVLLNVLVGRQVASASAPAPAAPMPVININLNGMPLPLAPSTQPSVAPTTAPQGKP